MADLEFAPDKLLETAEQEPAEEQEEGKVTLKMLQEILEAQNQKSEALVRAVLEKGKPLQQDLAAPELEISFEGMPDPGLDPQGYHKEFAKRYGEATSAALARTVEQSRSAAAAAVSDQAIRDQALAMIREAAPDLPDALIDFACFQVANSIRSRGEDPMTALRQDMQGVAQNILDFADETLGATRKTSQKEVNRTGGMLAPRQRRPAPPKVADEGPGDFAAEMRAEQKRLRIYG